MKLFILGVISLQVILCRGALPKNKPDEEINTTNLSTVIEYAKPLILYYAKNYAGSTKNDGKGVSFSTDITQIMNNGLTTGLLAGLRFLPYGTFVIVVWKVWSMRDTPEGQAIRKYLKESHGLDLDPMFRVIDENAASVGDKTVQNIQNIDTKTISETGEYIYGVLKSASIDPTAWKNSIASSFNSSELAKNAWGYISGTASSWLGSNSNDGKAK